MATKESDLGEFVRFHTSLLPADRVRIKNNVDQLPSSRVQNRSICRRRSSPYPTPAVAQARSQQQQEISVPDSQAFIDKVVIDRDLVFVTISPDTFVIQRFDAARCTIQSGYDIVHREAGCGFSCTCSQFKLSLQGDGQDHHRCVHTTLANEHGDLAGSYAGEADLTWLGLDEGSSVLPFLENDRASRLALCKQSPPRIPFLAYDDIERLWSIVSVKTPKQGTLKLACSVHSGPCPCVKAVMALHQQVAPGSAAPSVQQRNMAQMSKRRLETLPFRILDETTSESARAHASAWHPHAPATHTCSLCHYCLPCTGKDINGLQPRDLLLQMHIPHELEPVEKYTARSPEEQKSQLRTAALEVIGSALQFGSRVRQATAEFDLPPKRQAALEVVEMVETALRGGQRLLWVRDEHPVHARVYLQSMSVEVEVYSHVATIEHGGESVQIRRLYDGWDHRLFRASENILVDEELMQRVLVAQLAASSVPLSTTYVNMRDRYGKYKFLNKPQFFLAVNGYFESLAGYGDVYNDRMDDCALCDGWDVLICDGTMRQAFLSKRCHVGEHDVTFVDPAAQERKYVGSRLQRCLQETPVVSDPFTKNPLDMQILRRMRAVGSAMACLEYSKLIQIGGDDHDNFNAHVNFLCSTLTDSFGEFVRVPAGKRGGQLLQCEIGDRYHGITLPLWAKSGDYVLVAGEACEVLPLKGYNCTPLKHIFMLVKTESTNLTASNRDLLRWLGVVLNFLGTEDASSQTIPVSLAEPNGALRKACTDIPAFSPPTLCLFTFVRGSFPLSFSSSLSRLLSLLALSSLSCLSAPPRSSTQPASSQSCRPAILS